ncbi:hypothetical protein OAQ87_01170 [Candidatus Marinimicrobia bacterium]|nr:hypothetical protein [Candidatus Neomarinimicrobiota bacterium]
MKNKLIISFSALALLIVFYMINLNTQKNLESSSKRIFSIDKNVIQKIIITGGLSKLLSPYLSIEHTLDMDLTLKGIIYIDQFNN